MKLTLVTVKQFTLVKRQNYDWNRNVSGKHSCEGDHNFEES